VDSKNVLQQIFSIPVEEEKYIIYAPLKRIAFIANTAMVNSIIDRCNRNSDKDSPHEFLEELDFFTPGTIPEDDFQYGVQYDTVVLFLTNQCNLRCRYCYASSGDYPKKEMSWEVAKAGIDFVLSQVQKRSLKDMTLGFHGGGEPTMNWNVLTRATDYAHKKSQEYNLNLHVSGAFNGFWSEKICNYIIQNLTEISISFDGLAEVQNRQRPSLGNGDSFEKVTNTMKRLDAAGWKRSHESAPLCSHKISLIDTIVVATLLTLK